MEERKDFTSYNTGKTYKIKQKVDCDSAWVIYLSSCRKCGRQYVGKSKTPLKIRHSNHKQEIKKKLEASATTMGVVVVVVMPIFLSQSLNK